MAAVAMVALVAMLQTPAANMCVHTPGNTSGSTRAQVPGTCALGHKHLQNASWHSGQLPPTIFTPLLYLVVWWVGLQVCTWMSTSQATCQVVDAGPFPHTSTRTRPAVLCSC